jgi:endonuclease-8
MFNAEIERIMPEGPSIILAKEALRPLVGMTVAAADGYATSVDFAMLQGTQLKSIRTWGKHLLLKFNNFTLRIHFLMFGSFSVNEPKPQRNPKLAIKFKERTTVYFYTCAIQTIKRPLSHVYDWSADVMSDHWSTRKAIAKLKSHQNDLICDALLNQDIFSGVGNIIKNEVLFRMRIHPLNKVEDIPARRLKAIVDDTRVYSFLFLKWKRALQLKKHWEAYTKKECPRDGHSFTKIYAGQTRRRTFFCACCQERFAP